MAELKIKGLKKIAGETKNMDGYYSGRYLQLNYNLETGEAWVDFICSLGQNSWQEYHDPNILNCGNICTPMRMKEIREMIEDRVSMASAI